MRPVVVVRRRLLRLEDGVAMAQIERCEWWRHLLHPGDRLASDGCPQPAFHLGGGTRAVHAASDYERR
jgi:hypothetical protein